MVMDKVVKMAKLVEKCSGVVSEEISLQEFSDWCVENILTLRYIPIVEKSAIIGGVCDQIAKFDTKKMSTIQTTVAVEMYSLFFGVLSYTNVDFDGEDMTTENYDVLMESGFVKGILNTCEDDYKVFKQMFFEYLGVSVFAGVGNFLGKGAIKENSKAINAINRMMKNESGMNKLLELAKLSAIEDLKR